MNLRKRSKGQGERDSIYANSCSVAAAVSGCEELLLSSVVLDSPFVLFRVYCETLSCYPFCSVPSPRGYQSPFVLSRTVLYSVARASHERIIIGSAHYRGSYLSSCPKVSDVFENERIVSSYGVLNVFGLNIWAYEHQRVCGGGFECQRIGIQA